MKRILSGTALAVLTSAALVAAQAQSPTPSDPPSAPQSPPTSQSPATPPPSTSSRSSDKEKTTTWTGCLQTGTTAGTYVLSNASAGGSAASKSKAPETAGAAADTFALSGAPASFNISSHLNHKVEITGTVADMASAGGAPSQAGQAASADTATRTINVKSAKMISDRCTTN